MVNAYLTATNSVNRRKNVEKKEKIKYKKGWRAITFSVFLGGRNQKNTLPFGYVINQALKGPASI